MATETTARPIEACLLDLFQHLGIERAHIAAGGPPPLFDWYNLATLHPERVSSLTLISPPILNTVPLAGLASRLLTIAGDQGQLARGAAKLLADLPSVSSHILSGYEWHPWSDVIADRGAEIGSAMLDFLTRDFMRRLEGRSARPHMTGTSVAGLNFCAEPIGRGRDRGGASSARRRHGDRRSRCGSHFPCG